MTVRQLTAAGLAEFAAYLAACRQRPDAQADPPTHLLAGRATAALSASLDATPQAFATRRAAADYLHALLLPLPAAEVVANAGLWSWLALFHFDQLCQFKAGRRVVKNDYHYLYDPTSGLYSYRHLLFTGWNVRRIAGAAPTRLFLDVPLNRLDGMTEEVTKRPLLTRIPCIWGVLDRLYWDDARGRHRPGILGGKRLQPGDLIRLSACVRQLERTYDIYSLSADQLIDLLGPEFDPAAVSTEVGA